MNHLISRLATWSCVVLILLLILISGFSLKRRYAVEHLREQRDQLALNIAAKAPEIGLLNQKKQEWLLQEAGIPDEFQTVLGEQSNDYHRYVAGFSSVVREVKFDGGTPHQQPEEAADVLTPDDMVLKETAEIWRTPFEPKRIVPVPSDETCRNVLRVRRSEIHPDEYFKFYVRDWTLKGQAAKTVSAEIGIHSQFATGMDGYLATQMGLVRSVLDAYRTDCGLGGEVLIAFASRTQIMSSAVHIIVARYEAGRNAAEAAKKATTDDDKKNAKARLDAAQADIERGVLVFLTRL